MGAVQGLSSAAVSHITFIDEEKNLKITFRILPTDD
jgi:hypothetical protein